MRIFLPTKYQPEICSAGLNYMNLVNEWKNLEAHKNIVDNISELSVHKSSRIKDVFAYKRQFDDGYNAKRELGFQAVNPTTLYQLKSGDNNGKIIGGNVFTLNHCKYFVSEAPFCAADYFRVINDLNITACVSLARPNHDEYNNRKDKPLNLHYIKLGDYILFDDIKAECTEEITINLESDSYIKKSISVNGKKVTHFIYEGWQDMGSASAYVLYNLVKDVYETAHINNTKPNIAVNCKYGFGRSPAFAILYIMYSQIVDIKKQSLTNNLAKIEFDIYSYIQFMSENIMCGAGEIHINDIKKVSDIMLKELL